MSALAMLVAWGATPREHAASGVPTSPTTRRAATSVLDEFPELAEVPAATEDAPEPEIDQDGTFREPDIAAWLARHGGPHGFALLRRILESDATPPPMRGELLSRVQFRNGHGLRAAADAETDRLLLRALGSPRISEMAWIESITAVCRPDVSAAGLHGLVAVVLDDTLPLSARREVLAHLANVGDRVPLRIAALADLPWMGARASISRVLRDRPEAAEWLAPPTDAHVRRSVVPASREDLLAMDDADIDPAVGAVVLLRDQQHAGVAAEQLDRLARYVQGEVARAADPAAKLDALCRPLRAAGSMFNPEPTDVRNVLRGREGNCLSLSLIVTGVARRLGLPVHLVYCPGHVFVRWDDGTTRLNMDPAGGWASHDDAWYVEEMDAIRGRYPDLDVIGPRTALAIVAVNASITRLERGDLAGAREMLQFADAADRHCPTIAYLRSAVALVASPDDRPAALTHVRGVVDVRRVSRHHYIAFARLFLAAGAADEALAWVDGAIARGPSSLGLRVERARCLLALRRDDEFRRALRDLRRESADSVRVAVIEADARRRRGDAGWFDAFRDASEGSDAFRFDYLAEHLLTNGDLSEESARAALAATEAAATARTPFKMRHLPEIILHGDERPHRARALEILGRSAEAVPIRAALGRAARILWDNGFIDEEDGR